MKYSIKIVHPYLLQLAYVVIGLILLVSISLLSKNLGINPTIPMLILFLILYFAGAYFLKLLPSVRTFLQLKRIYLLVIGIVAGAIIQGTPFFLTHSNDLSKEVTFNLLTQITLSGTFFTFLIVLWEELWFRNPVLNLVDKKNKQVLMSVFTGLLFASIHLMNPKINIFQEVPELFLAGFLLTVSYYASGSFWMPLGLHFGNNFLSSLIEKANLDISGKNIGINQEIIFRWVILAMAIGIIFFLWPNGNKGFTSLKGLNNNNLR